MISVEDLYVAFGGFELFKSISFIVNPRDRIGLAGRNGAGKSTLLKIFAGLQLPTSGRVVVPKDIKIGYLPQQMEITDSKTLLEEAESAFTEIKQLEHRLEFLNEELAHRKDYESEEYHQMLNEVHELNERFELMGGTNYHVDMIQTLTGLGFESDDLQRMTSEFSGGWRMRIELAKILLQKPNVFLLDEPTNHLDIESIQWLESFLKDYAGAVVLVSHDKAFLDNVTTRTVELSLGKLYDYKVNYSKYLELRVERREQLIAAFRNQQKLIKDTEEFIERFRYKATKAIQVQSRIKQLEKLERIEVDVEDNRSLNLRFPPSPRSGSVVFEAKRLSKQYDSHHVLDRIDFTINRGNRVAFVGKNGEGKTTMVRIIMQELDYKGDQKLGHNVRIGYFAQNQAELLNPDLTALETIDKVAVGDIRTRIRDILGAFMFSGEEADKKVKVLSGGERSRLAMIRLLLEPVNFLVLDEPTNHLDIHSKDLLKQALMDFDGTLLIVSHDREFMNGLVDVVYEFHNKKIRQHLGGIYDFLQKKKIESFRELEKAAPVKKIKQEITKDPEAISFEERKEINRIISRLEKQVNDIETSITGLEKKMVSLDLILSNPTADNFNSHLQDYTSTQTEFEKAMKKWENLHLQLEDWTRKKTW